jgi:hypothetical protein
MVPRLGALMLLAVSSLQIGNAVKLPLSTSGRWFLDGDGNKFTYIGVNWPGHMETMIPEGLSHQSIATITSKIKDLGMNSIRLTYATEMIDDIVNRKGDTTVRQSFIKTFGERNGLATFDKIMAKNPNINETTTRLQVFDAVAAECSKQGIIIHLDNHISKAKWCCGGQDANSWFGDKEFGTENWKRGWKFMAKHVWISHGMTVLSELLIPSDVEMAESCILRSP